MDRPNLNVDKNPSSAFSSSISSFSLAVMWEPSSVAAGSKKSWTQTSIQAQLTLQLSHAPLYYMYVYCLAVNYVQGNTQTSHQ